MDRHTEFFHAAFTPQNDTENILFHYFNRPDHRQYGFVFREITDGTRRQQGRIGLKPGAANPIRCAGTDPDAPCSRFRVSEPEV
jgi:hypothetical protein